MKATYPSTHPDTCTSLAALFAASCLSFAAASSYAGPQPGEQPSKKVVPYGDLNLGAQQGVDRLYRRITAAAREVCGDAGSLSLAEWAHVRNCVDQSIARAVANVGNRDLAALHARKTGRPVDREPMLSKK